MLVMLLLELVPSSFNYTLHPRFPDTLGGLSAGPAANAFTEKLHDITLIDQRCLEDGIDT